MPAIDGWKRSTTLGAEAGVRAAAYLPLSGSDEPFGVLAVATRSEPGTERLIRRLPLLAEYAAIARALLLPALETGARVDELRTHLERIIAECAFSPVFQPIVELETGDAVGFEALTRFTDGVPPNQRFHDAVAMGLTVELELACLRAALDASRVLPAGAWLSLNVSPAVVLAAEGATGTFQPAGRDAVLEITEHAGSTTTPASAGRRRSGSRRAHRDR